MNGRVEILIWKDAVRVLGNDLNICVNELAVRLDINYDTAKQMKASYVRYFLKDKVRIK